MINVAKAIRHPKLSQTINVFRKTEGKWINGRFSQEEIVLVLKGVISPAKARDIEMIPEGDRVGGEIAVFTTEKIFITNSKGTSDEIMWNGERYKLYAVNPYKDYGYYKAIAVRKDSA